MTLTHFQSVIVFSDWVRFPPTLPPSLHRISSRSVHSEQAQRLKLQSKHQRKMPAPKSWFLINHRANSNVIRDHTIAWRNLIILMWVAGSVLWLKLQAAKIKFQSIIQLLRLSFRFRPLMFFCQTSCTKFFHPFKLNQTSASVNAGAKHSVWLVIKKHLTSQWYI